MVAVVGKIRFGAALAGARFNQRLAAGGIAFWVGSWIVAGAPVSIGVLLFMLAVLAVPVAWLLLFTVPIRRRFLEFVDDGTIRIRHDDVVNVASSSDVKFLVPTRNYLIYRDVKAIINGVVVDCPYAHSGPIGLSRGMKRFIKALGENGIEYEFY